MTTKRSVVGIKRRGRKVGTKRVLLLCVCVCVCVCVCECECGGKKV